MHLIMTPRVAMVECIIQVDSFIKEPLYVQSLVDLIGCVKSYLLCDISCSLLCSAILTAVSNRSNC